MKHITLSQKGVYTLLSVLFSVVFTLNAADNVDQWSWLYRKKFNEKQRETNRSKTETYFAKEDIPHFTQLIFSWNAFRPSNGYFSFFIQARDAESKKWGKWHHVADWGAEIQRSFNSKSDGLTKYVHVRLETESQKLSDAFRLKVTAISGANLFGIKEFAFAITNYNLFKPEKLGEQITQLPSVYISNVPQISQFELAHKENARICSPTSCTMLTRFLTESSTDPRDFADNAYDHGLDAYGSWPFNIAHAFEQSGGTISFFTTRLNSFAMLYHQLSRGIPAVVSVRGWLPGAPKIYRHGHLLVVVGWDKKTKEVICHDPAFATHEKTVQRYPFESFVRAWEASRRLVYWSELSHSA